MNKGKLIKVLRLKNSLNQSELAKKSGISENYLSQIENGKRNPPVNIYNKIAEALNVSVNIFLWEEVDLKKIKGKENKELAKKINNNFKEIKRMIFNEIIGSES